MNMRRCKAYTVAFLMLASFLGPSALRAQKASESLPLASPPWVVSVQPMMLLAPPVGGLRMGMEKTFGKTFGIGTELSYRAIQLPGQFREPGETDRMTGLQLQPELRWYLGPSGRRKIPWRSSFGARLGWSGYSTDVRNWTFLTDGSGNGYRKLLGYRRQQRNYDISLLWNYRIPFDREGTGFGMEIFMGIGIRVKRFEYRDISPELDADNLRAQDASRMFSLRRDGTYPLLPVGFRLYRMLR